MTHERLTAMPQKGIPGHCHLAQIFGADGNSVACIDSTADPEIASERARRLVACWNACDGLSTEALEQEPYIGGASYVMRRNAEAQRDELLAALQALDAIGVLEPDLIGIGEEIERAVRLARAAIQKATNKEQA